MSEAITAAAIIANDPELAAQAERVRTAMERRDRAAADLRVVLRELTADAHAASAAGDTHRARVLSEFCDFVTRLDGGTDGD